ncbi:MAG TPA: hypothetical protein VGR70_04200 [Stellaceae bacterium]|nr:hypothetical protein [Stellaceae bacterium]
MFDSAIRKQSARQAPLIVPLHPELHRLAVLEERDALLAERSEGPAAEARHCNRWGYALLGRGHVLAAGGLVPLWAGRAEAWLLVSRYASPRDLVPALRHARDVLDKRQRDPFFRRIEINVRWEAPWRESFVSALGFELEAIMDSWGPDGADYGLYARIADHG